MKIKEGIIIYNIECNNCLNGVYTNELASGIIFNEIAIKKDQLSSSSIEGEYNCAYFENSNQLENVTLTIASNKSGIYEFQWRLKGKIIFEGIGYRMKQNQIIVHYKSV